MKILKYIIVIVSVIFLFNGCGVVSKSQISKGQLYPKLYEEHPTSILVLPAKNTTTSVDSTNHFRYTITKPLAEKGYYVFPVHLVDSFFKSENLSDTELIRNIPVQKLKEIFNTDAILYVDINAWDTNYSVLSSSVDVGLSFSLVDSNSGEELWQNNAYAYSYAGPDGSNGLVGLIVSAIAAAINTSVDYTELAYVSNNAGVSLLPAGVFNKNFKIDSNNKLMFTNNTNLKDGRLYVNEYFIHGNKSDEKVALTARGRLKGYHSFSVTNMNFFNHNGYENYYLTQNINEKKYLRNRFFMYENNKPYLLANGKKVFVFVESDGNIPFSEESGEYYFQIDRVVELTKSNT
jgi:hypothetical protein